MITLPFNFKNNEYAALVREKMNAGQKEFHVTIMNGELEQLFFGNRVIKECDCEDSCCVSEHMTPESQSAIAQLKSAIIKALRENMLLTSRKRKRFTPASHYSTN
jgi:hypothetical protein